MLPRLVSKVDPLAKLDDERSRHRCQRPGGGARKRCGPQPPNSYPLLWAVIITGLEVLLLLGLQRFGMRTIEAIVLPLVATISVCYYIGISFCHRPSFWNSRIYMWSSLSIAGTKNRLQNAPEVIGIIESCGPYVDHFKDFLASARSSAL
jgi:hypothetical protein